ncbi:dihydrofolate reductase family protein [Alteribacter populi]|uniref:dihydrofolate reductase family protein n=1 Tax=Alteribacter populi TaxID=2011011 RepID=UPI000BBA77BD|nr:dihydrofolate reductase family protein [Alteribacter populi]
MGKVCLDISMSLDGFIAGPNDGPKNPLGDDGERIHKWVYELESWRKHHGLTGGKANKDAEIVEESLANTGAIVMGKRMFNNGEKYWGDTPPFHMPVFVLTHEPRDKEIKEGGTTFTFVTDGIESAINQAKAVAGDKDVSVAGGANVVQQYIKAGKIDEVQIHLVPVLLGEGIRLFEHLGKNHIELEKSRVIESPDVTHLKFRVVE